MLNANTQGFSVQLYNLGRMLITGMTQIISYLYVLMSCPFNTLPHCYPGLNHYRMMLSLNAFLPTLQFRFKSSQNQFVWLWITVLYIFMKFLFLNVTCILFSFLEKLGSMKISLRDVGSEIKGLGLYDSFNYSLNQS